MDGMDGMDEMDNMDRRALVVEEALRCVARDVFTGMVMLRAVAGGSFAWAEKTDALERAVCVIQLLAVKLVAFYSLNMPVADLLGFIEGGGFEALGLAEAAEYPLTAEQRGELLGVIEQAAREVVRVRAEELLGLAGETTA